MQPINNHRVPLLHVDAWIFKVPDFEEINRKLLPEILAHKEQEPAPLSQSNSGCWRGSRHYANAGALMAFIQSRMKLIVESYEYRDGLNLDDYNGSVNYWSNVNSRGASNLLHAHNQNNDDWSGCYYLQSTGTGAIRLYSEQSLHSHIKEFMPYGLPREIFPEDGDLVLFPSYVLHEVDANPIDRERINLAFNIKFSPKTG